MYILRLAALQNRPPFPLDSNQSMMDLSMPPPISMSIQTDQYVAQITSMQSKVNEFKEQILQSEKNLKLYLTIQSLVLKMFCYSYVN